MSRRTIVGLLLCSVMLPGCPWDHTEKDFEQLLQDDGFKILSPPNQVDGPGAVIAIDQDGGITALVCTSAESVGTSFQPIMSPTTSVTIDSSSSAGASITGKLYDYLTADIDGSVVADIKASLTNAFDVTASESQLMSASSNRTAECANAIISNQQQGLKVATITEVYKADYNVNIAFSAKADANIQIQITDKLALKLGGMAAVMSTNQITGTDLFWGYKVQPVFH